MQVFPDAYLDLTDAPPWLSLILIILAAAGAVVALRAGPLYGVEQSFLVLLLAGVLPALESALGRWMLLAATALCVVVAWLAGTATLDTAPAILIGATGSGLVGFAAGLFRQRLVRPLFVMPGRISTLTVAALILGGLWLVLEIALLLVSADWPWLARLSCGASGFVLGALFSILGLRQPGMMGSRLEGMTAQDGLTEAQALAEAHDLKRARRLLDDLAKSYPYDVAVRELRYSTWKFNPEEAGFHGAAIAMLDQDEDGADTYHYIARYYKDYLAVTQGQPKLPVELHLGLGERFARGGDLKQAANIINPYLQRDSKDKNLPRAVITLAEAYMLGDNPVRATQLAELVSVKFQGSQESMIARRLLRQLNNG